MTVWRVLAAVLLLALCTSTVTVTSLLKHFAPAHQWLLEELLPGFEVHSLGAEEVGPHLKLRTALQNRSFVVMSGRVISPGYRFSAETPARHAIFCGVLVLAAPLLQRSFKGLRLWLLSALAGAVSFAMLLTLPPLILAGSIWSLISPGEAGTLSVEALAIWASRSILHGSAVMLALLVCGLSAMSVQRDDGTRGDQMLLEGADTPTRPQHS